MSGFINAFNDLSYSMENKCWCKQLELMKNYSPFEDETIPGVGLAAITVMLKSHHFVPSNKVVLAGNRPLLMLSNMAIIQFEQKLVQ